MLIKTHSSKIIRGAVAVATLWTLSGAYAQDRDRDFDRDRLGVTRLEPGMVIPVRTDETIDVERTDQRIYPGRVDQDVRGENGALAIPRGSHVELIVRVRPDNDLVLDLESVTVNGQRYALSARPDHIESRPDNSIVGAIVGAVTGAQMQGRAVRVQRDTVIGFRLQQPLTMGIADRGVDREGHHYHDYYNDYYNDRR
jgi:hypothetical protein